MYVWLSWELTWKKKSIYTGHGDIVIWFQTRIRYNNPKSKTLLLMLLHLWKSLYGQRQSSHDWYSTSTDYQISIGFMPSCFNVGRFKVNVTDAGEIITTVIVHVDNLLMIANDGLIREVHELMKKGFQMRGLWNVSFCINLNIIWNLVHYMTKIL